MYKLLKYIRITIAGGLLFMIPVVVAIIIISKAIALLYPISKPLAEKLPFKVLGGMGIASILSILFLLLICFVAGLFIRTTAAKKIKHRLEDDILVYIPGYSYLKTVSTQILDSEKKQSWKPASILVDDNEVICFVIDETENYCSLFLPSSPSPSTGSICVREKKIVTYLPLTVLQANRMIKQNGKGGAEMFEKMRAIKN
jgi:uncharacterized membrane protein